VTEPIHAPLALLALVIQAASLGGCRLVPSWIDALSEDNEMFEFLAISAMGGLILIVAIAIWRFLLLFE
jgi:hypothetical protein